MKPSSGSGAATTSWSVQVEQFNPCSLDLPYSFQIAIYESLVDELRKTMQFQQVFREGDGSASEAPHLLVLQTTVEKYSPGSETRRAVTTIGGSTKVIVLKRTVDGDVLFFSSNWRATHNLASNHGQDDQGIILARFTRANRVDQQLKIGGFRYDRQYTNQR